MKLKIFLLLAASMLLPAVSVVAGLIPEQCYMEGSHLIGEYPFSRPLRFVNMTFDGGIELTPDAVAHVTYGNETVVSTTSFDVFNYESTKRTQGELTILFSGECLPKGKEYSLHLASGSVRLLDNPEVTNDEAVYSFEIPEDLGEASFDNYENGCTIVSMSDLRCTWWQDAFPVGNPEWELYRAGELIRKYPAPMSWDWDIGTAYLDFGEEIHFEYGVNYRILLPEGSACGYRPDIVSRDVILDFTGESFRPSLSCPAYDWCSLEEECPETVNEVSFVFTIPIGLIEGQPVVLSDTEHPDNRWEAMPTLSEEGSRWILTADFGGVGLDKARTYTVGIPEGTVVTANGDIAVNRLQSTVVGSRSGIAETASEACGIAVEGDTVRITGCAPRDVVRLYDINGSLLREIREHADSVIMEVGGKGCYMVSVGDRIFKIII